MLAYKRIFYSTSKNQAFQGVQNDGRWITLQAQANGKSPEPHAVEVSPFTPPQSQMAVKQSPHGKVNLWAAFKTVDEVREKVPNSAVGDTFYWKNWETNLDTSKKSQEMCRVMYKEVAKLWTRKRPRSGYESLGQSTRTRCTYV